MNPKKFLELSQHNLKAMREMKKKHVAVGILASEATGRVYKNGMNVLKIAVIHEFGLGTSPQRSFLRMPQELKRKELNAFIRKQLGKVFEGMEVEKGLGIIGIYAENLAKEAFETGGFGKWPDIASETKRKKGSSGILIDTQILKNSIASEVR